MIRGVCRSAIIAFTFTVLSACADSTSQRSSETSAVPEERCTKVDTEQHKKEIRLDKARLSKVHAGSPPANAGDWAYASDPVDVEGPGTYAFRFGSIDKDFDFPRTPVGVTFDFGGFLGRVTPTSGRGPIITSGADGSRYFEAWFDVAGGVLPCTDLVIFVV